MLRAYFLAVAILAAAVPPGLSRAIQETVEENEIQDDFYPGSAYGAAMAAQPYNYGYQQAQQPMMVYNEAPPMAPPMVAAPMGYQQVQQYQYPGYALGYPIMDAALQNLGPNFAGLDQAPFQEVSNDEEFSTLVKAGGPYSGTYAQEMLLQDQDIVGYMSMPNQLDDIPLTGLGHDMDEHNKLLHEPAQSDHGFLNNNLADEEDDQANIAYHHDALVDKSIHAMSQIGTQHDEMVHRHVHPDEFSRDEADKVNDMQRDQKGFEHRLDQLTWKINGEKEAKHYGESQFELSSGQPGDPNHVGEGMPFEVLLKGGSYYDRIGRHSYITTSTAITLGALLGVLFLMCGCLLAIIYCKGVSAVLDFFLCLIGFSCLMPIPPPKPDAQCGNKGSCCKCSQDPIKYPKATEKYVKKYQKEKQAEMQQQFALQRKQQLEAIIAGGKK